MKKYIVISLIVWNVFFFMLLFFSYDANHDTLASISKDYLKWTELYMFSTVSWYLLNKLAIKIEEKYKGQ